MRNISDSKISYYARNKQIRQHSGMENRKAKKALLLAVFK